MGADVSVEPSGLRSDIVPDVIAVDVILMLAF